MIQYEYIYKEILCVSTIAPYVLLQAAEKRRKHPDTKRTTLRQYMYDQHANLSIVCVDPNDEH